VEKLIDILGEDVLSKLSDAFGGQRIYIPTKSDIHERNLKMRTEFTQMLSSGSTCMNAYHNLAEKNDLSIRRVQSIVNAQ